MKQLTEHLVGQQKTWFATCLAVVALLGSSCSNVDNPGGFEQASTGQEAELLDAPTDDGFDVYALAEEPDLEIELRRGDAIVRTGKIKQVSFVDDRIVESAVYEISIDEVLAFEPADDDEAPGRAPADIIRIFENRVVGDGIFQLEDFKNGSDRELILILSCCSFDDRAKEIGATWSVGRVIAQENDGSISFYGDGGGFDELNIQLDALRSSGRVDGNDLDLLQAAYGEAHDSKSPRRLLSVLDKGTPVDPGSTEGWQQLPAKDRFLGVGVAPDDVLEQLDEVLLLIDVPVAVRSEGSLVTLSTTEGVSYVGTLESNRVARVFVPKNGRLSLTLSDDAGRKTESPLDVGSVTRDGTIYFAIPADLKQFHSSDVADSARVLSSKEADEVLASWAVEGTPGPEPDELTEIEN